MGVGVNISIPGFVKVTVMKTPPGSSVAMLEGRGLELEGTGISAEGAISGVSVAILEGMGLELGVAGGTVSGGGTISGGETTGEGETTSDVVFWVGHDKDPLSRLTGQ